MSDLVKRLRGWARDIYEGSTATWAMDQDLKSAADRIEELEATGLANRVAIMRLEAKLAKAVEFIGKLKQYAVAIDDRHLHGKAVSTLAELTGGKDE